MIKRILIDILLVLSILMLTYTRYVDLSIMNTIPDFLLIFVVIIGLFDENDLHSILLGFIGGLCIDFMAGTTPLGFNAFLYTLIGYIAVFPSKLFNVNSVFVNIFSVTIFAVVKVMFFALLGYFFLSKDEVIGYFGKPVHIEVLYTMIVSIPIFFILRSIYNFIDSMRKHG